MNQIGIIAAGLFVIIGVFMAMPLLFTHAFRSGWENSPIANLPNWAYYIILFIFSISFWSLIGMCIYLFT